MRNPHQWEVVHSKPIADCRVFKVGEDISVNAVTNACASFFATENPEWINIIPICIDGQVLLIE